MTDKTIPGGHRTLKINLFVEMAVRRLQLWHLKYFYLSLLTMISLSFAVRQKERPIRHRQEFNMELPK